MKKFSSKNTDKNSVAYCKEALATLSDSDLRLGEAVLAHIEKFKSPQREREFVKFVFSWNQEAARKVA